LARNNFLKQSKALILLVSDLKRVNWRGSCIYMVGLPDLKTTKTGRQGEDTRAWLSIQVK
jgi:hypothetical protein